MSIFPHHISAKDARDHFAETIDRVRINGERVVIQRSGRSMVAIVPLDDLETLQRLEDAADRDAARQALAYPDRVPWEDIKKALKL